MRIKEQKCEFNNTYLEARSKLRKFLLGVSQERSKVKVLGQSSNEASAGGTGVENQQNGH